MTREEAIHEIKQWDFINNDEMEALRTLIPELRESEDERMVREFNDWLCGEIECRTNDLRDEKDRRTLNMLCYVLTKVKDWLEKQKDHFRDDTKMVEQKSAENGVDVIKTSALLAADRLASAEMTGRLKERSEILENPEEYGLHKPAEWSKEDADILNGCISSIEEAKENRYAYKETDGDTSYDREIDWLKSLRPQLHWKPNEEQMMELSYASKVMWESESRRKALKSLYNDLLKLM